MWLNQQRADLAAVEARTFPPSPTRRPRAVPLAVTFPPEAVGAHGRRFVAVAGPFPFRCEVVGLVAREGAPLTIDAFDVLDGDAPPATAPDLTPEGAATLHAAMLCGAPLALLYAPMYVPTAAPFRLRAPIEAGSDFRRFRVCGYAPAALLGGAVVLDLVLHIVPGDLAANAAIDALQRPVTVAPQLERSRDAAPLGGLHPERDDDDDEHG